MADASMNTAKFDTTEELLSGFIRELLLDAEGSLSSMGHTYVWSTALTLILFVVLLFVTTRGFYKTYRPPVVLMATAAVLTVAGSLALSMCIVLCSSHSAVDRTIDKIVRKADDAKVWKQYYDSYACTEEAKKAVLSRFAYKGVKWEDFVSDSKKGIFNFFNYSGFKEEEAKEADNLFYSTYATELKRQIGIAEGYLGRQVKINIDELREKSLKIRAEEFKRVGVLSLDNILLPQLLKTALEALRPVLHNFISRAAWAFGLLALLLPAALGLIAWHANRYAKLMAMGAPLPHTRNRF